MYNNLLNNNIGQCGKKKKRPSPNQITIFHTILTKYDIYQGHNLK